MDRSSKILTFIAQAEYVTYRHGETVTRPNQQPTLPAWINPIALGRTLRTGPEQAQEGCELGGAL